MVNLEEINAEITKMEEQPLTYGTIQKLSWLYTVRDHTTISTAEIPKGDSDFMRCCSGRTVCQVMDVMDELMAALMIIQPRLYDAVIDKLS